MTMVGSNDIISLYVAYVDGSGGKKRPVLVRQTSGNKIDVFRITSKFSNKSFFIKQQYFKIDDWKQAGLNKASWVDLGSIKSFDLNKVSYDSIGALSTQDVKRISEFSDSFIKNRAKILFKNILQKKVFRVVESILENTQIPSEMIKKNLIIAKVTDKQIEIGIVDFFNSLKGISTITGDTIKIKTEEYIKENYSDAYLGIKAEEEINITKIKQTLQEELVENLMRDSRFKGVGRLYWISKVHKVKSTSELVRYARNNDLDGFTSTYASDWEEINKNK
ncbi:TPA: hypothetical protein QFM54_001869 [Enterococcus faecium]